MAHINKYGMLEGDNPEEDFQIRNPNFPARRLGGGTIGNPTKYYDPNEAGNANFTEDAANYGREIARGPTRGTFGQFFRNSQTPQSRAERGERPIGGTFSRGLGMQPDIAKQVLAQVLPETLAFGGPAGMATGMTAAGATSLASSNGTTQPARSLSDIASGTNHAQQWMNPAPGTTRATTTPYGSGTTSYVSPEQGTRRPYIGGLTDRTADFVAGGKNSSAVAGSDPTLDTGYLRSKYGFGSGLAQEDTIENSPFQKTFGGGLPTPTPTPPTSPRLASAGIPSIAPPIANAGRSTAFPGLNTSNLKYAMSSNIPVKKIVGYDRDGKPIYG